MCCSLANGETKLLEAARPKPKSTARRGYQQHLLPFQDREKGNPRPAQPVIIGFFQRKMKKKAQKRHAGRGEEEKEKSPFPNHNLRNNRSGGHTDECRNAIHADSFI